MLSRLVRTAAGAGGQALEYTFTSDSLHADLLTLAVASGWDATKSGTFTAYVGDGTNPVGLYSNSGSSSQYGLSLGSGWAAETIINLIVRNNGHIVGTAGTAGGGGGGVVLGALVGKHTSTCLPKAVLKCRSCPTHLVCRLSHPS